MRKLLLALCATTAIAAAPFAAAGTASAAPAVSAGSAVTRIAAAPNASHWIYIAHFSTFNDCDDNAAEIVNNGWYRASYCSWNPTYGHWDLHGLTNS
jgi:hypothetical protein